MPYDVPGRADELNADLVERWNSTLQGAFDQLAPQLGSRFFTLDVDNVMAPVPASIHWFADPAEPNFCIGREAARTLSDWGLRGRHVLHNEYCEYRVIQKVDSEGRLRPKRVQVTTELREYWVCIAKADPFALRDMVDATLGVTPDWEEIYGVGDPLELDERQREVAFSTLVAGHGADQSLIDAGVPTQPTGRLNTDNALFMTHPINGLDDLLYIVMFGAKPYGRRVGVNLEAATREQIFRHFGVEQLACRHADPAAAMGAQGAVLQGRTVAFANPLGMYIQSFSQDLFLFEGNTIRDQWVRLSRGQPGMHQRLEIGPPDEEAVFLDDIMVAVGGNEEPLTGGFQVLQQIEVGPLVAVGEETPVSEDEFVIMTTSDAPIACEQASICAQIRALQQEFDDSHGLQRVGPRRLGRPFP